VAAKDLGYSTGSFPECEAQANDIITLPAHHFITDDQVDFMIDCISAFYQS
jgi:dTDP-4-amino-4,6-dideoxygalactose transaminase